jgi:hypothetical protein
MAFRGSKFGGNNDNDEARERQLLVELLVIHYKRENGANAVRISRDRQSDR